MTEADELAGQLTASGHELRQRVYFEDTDFSGLVYHARYLRSNP
jgi:acyl-CoA thioester hydrolase